MHTLFLVLIEPPLARKLFQYLIGLLFGLKLEHLFDCLVQVQLHDLLPHLFLQFLIYLLYTHMLQPLRDLNCEVLSHYQWSL